MDKNAQLTAGSPCEYCGLPSVQLIQSGAGSVPMCARHLQIADSADSAKGASLIKFGQSTGKTVPAHEFLSRIEQVDAAADRLKE
jgi:hypothetical protein